MGKEFERCFLKIEKELGSGQFGVVYKGFAYGIDGAPDYTPVAVKSLKGKKYNQKHKTGNIDEISAHEQWRSQHQYLKGKG